MSAIAKIARRTTKDKTKKKKFNNRKKIIQMGAKAEPSETHKFKLLRQIKKD